MDDVNQLGCAVRCPQNEEFENGRRCNTKACTIHPLIRATNQPAATAPVTTAKAALAQSTSFCTVGAPLRPIAPTISPSTLMGNPPPHAAIRASVGTPAKSEGAPRRNVDFFGGGTPHRALSRPETVQVVVDALVQCRR